MAWSFVSITDNGDVNPGASISTSAAVSMSAGNAIVVWVTWGSGASASEAVSDGTNTYTKLATLNDTTNGQSSAVFYCLNASAGSRSVTFSCTAGTQYRGLVVAVYSGLATSGTPDGAATNNSAPGSGAGAVTSGNLTPSGQPGVLIGFSLDDSGGEASLSAATGFTSRSSMATIAGAFGVLGRVEDKNITSTSATAATFTAGTGGGRFLTQAIYIQEPGGGGGGVTVKSLAALGVG